MISITQNDDAVSVTGHAGYAELGKDIVCAGVTALVQGLVESIRQLTQDMPEWHMSSGEFQLNTENLSKESLFLISSFFIAVQLIADEFPGHVQIRRGS